MYVQKGKLGKILASLKSVGICFQRSQSSSGLQSEGKQGAEFRYVTEFPTIILKGFSEFVEKS